VIRLAGPATASRKAPVPCILVTGALGSGKTTLIRALLREPEMAGTVLVINEFGEVGIDDRLVASAVESTVLMENGCLCCSLRGDVVDAVGGLLGAAARGEIPPFRRILIETTGLADPAPILQDLAAARSLEGRVAVEAVVTTVDALLAQPGPAMGAVALSQIAQADLCLMTKCDLADPLVVDGLRDALGAINPLMAIHEVRGGRLPPGLAEELRRRRATAAVPVCDAVADAAGAVSAHGVRPKDGAPAPFRHDSVASWSIELDRPLPWPLLRDWFRLLYSLRPADILRLKAVLDVEGRDRPVVVQAVGPVFDPPSELEAWPPGARRGGLVVIARGLEPAAIGRSFTEEVLDRAGAEGIRAEPPPAGAGAAGR